MQFRILGPLEVLERDVAQPLGGAKQRAVLGILILHRGEPVSGERLADELWGERPPATAGKTLQGYISRLRKRLGDEVLRWETGGSAEIEVLIKDAVCMFPTRPVFRCALAYLHARLGDASRAQAEIDDLAADDFAAVQRDNEYLFSLAFVADAVGTLADVPAAAVLYDLLVPYAHLNAINADEVGTGSVSRTLGVLAAVLSRWEDGTRHFQAAVGHNQTMGALPWLAHTKHDYARMLLARDMPGDRERAQQLLIAATEQYERLGMTPWLARASELVATP